MDSILMHKRKLFVLILAIELILIAIVFFFSPNNTFSQFADAPVIGNERYYATFSESMNEVPDYILSTMSKEEIENNYLVVTANYQDKNGNNFFNDKIDEIEYSCGEDDTCKLVYNETVDDIAVWNFEYGSSLDNKKIELPTSFHFDGVEYKLNHYYATYGNDVSHYFCKPKITLNSNSINTKMLEYSNYYSYFSDKIIPSESLNDSIDFKWNFNNQTVKITNNVIGNGADLSKEFNYLIEYQFNVPDGKYGDINVTDNIGNFKLKNGESISLSIIGNFNVYIESDEYGYIPSYTTNSTIISYYDEFFTKEETGGEINYTHTFTAAKPLIVKNIVENPNDMNKEFGFTIYLSDATINGIYSGIKFTNGVGRFHLKPNEEKSILLPNTGINYHISRTRYIDYTNILGEFFTGNISDTESIIVESKCKYNATAASSLNGVYSATVVTAEELIPGHSYVVFRATGGIGYMLTGKGNAKELTSYCSGNGCKVTWPDSGDAYSNVLWTYNGNLDKAILESFGAVNSYLTVGKSTSGNRPVSSEPSYVKLETTTSPAIKVSNEKYYLALTSDKKKYTSSTSSNSLYFAEIDENIYSVEFNGSNDGLHIYNGTYDKNYSVISGDEIVVPTEENVKTPEKYNYKLKSWIELNTGIEVKPGETLTVDNDYKFYANWIPKSYNIGKNKNVVNSTDTSDFITTEVFDYNELYNLYSSNYENSRWSLVPNGQNVFLGSANNSGIKSRGVVFVDNAKNSKSGLLNSIDHRDDINASKQVVNGENYYDGIVTNGIGKYVIDDLFNKNSKLYGVNYVGKGKYLYQYNDKNGFYYYDSSKNAAAYNQEKERFYIYDYTYGTSKSHKENENKTDFLPFNYLTKEEATAGKNISSSNGATNYWFGFKSEIKFDLIDTPGTIDSLGKFGNKDKFGNDMILKFSGDDDVWIYLDDKFVLDLGGIHDIVYGEINFSTGIITVAQKGARINYNDISGFSFDINDISDTSKIQQTKLTNVTPGNHTLDIYYVERGASRSNVALYFNINDKYDQPGDIIIERRIDSSNSDKKHEFTMLLNNTNINGTYGDVTFNSGVALFKLAGGEKVRISGLPAGIKYKVMAKVPDGNLTKFISNGKTYETEYLEGRVVGGNLSHVEYQNISSPESDDNETIDSDTSLNDNELEQPPETLDDTITYVYLLIASMIIIFGVLIYKRKKK